MVDESALLLWLIKQRWQQTYEKQICVSCVSTTLVLREERGEHLSRLIQISCLVVLDQKYGMMM